MAKAKAPLLDLVDYCKICELRPNAITLTISKDQGAWHSRRVAFKDILELVSH